MFSKIISIASMALVFLMTGCATPTSMPFSDAENSTIKSDKSIYLMTATIRNAHRTSHQPKAYVLHVEKSDAKEKADRLNFKIDKLAKNETDISETGSTYYLRMELEKGEYVIRGISSMSSSFPIIGHFFTPIHEKLTPSGPGVFYLGHVEATVRERKGEEFKAGPSIPLIDQAASGASTSTFDVVMSDQWKTDEGNFKTRFPVLNSATIQKEILPPFDRPLAQAWWTAN